MPIKANDIREKEFTIVKKDGYNSIEVDDFLDELADQLDVLLTENVELAKERDELKAQLASRSEGAAAAPARDDTSYFTTLEAEVRKAISSAQESKEAIIRDAEAEAEGIISKAKAEVEALTQEETGLKERVSAYRKSFAELIKAQEDILSATDL